MNDANGDFYAINHAVEPEFFNQEHEAIIIYNPGEFGYLELFIDGKHVQRQYIGTDIIWADYNNYKAVPLSFGKSEHGGAGYYEGYVKETRFVYEALKIREKSSISITTNKQKNMFSIFGNGKIFSVSLSLE